MEVGTAKVIEISYFPVKGLAGGSLERVEIQTGCGLPLDRAFAFRYRAAGSPLADLRELPWTPKTMLAVQHDWPALARLSCSLDEKKNELTIGAPGGAEVRASVESDAGREELARFVTEFLKSTKPSPPSRNPSVESLELAGSLHAGTRYPDRGKLHVSILNMATLRELEDEFGHKLDMRSFRGNLIVDGIPAWGEFEWDKKTLQIGGVTIAIHAPLMRCHNINVQPETGDDSVPALELLRERYGHGKFGVIGTVLQGGTIAVGDSVQVQTPAPG